MSDQDIVDLIKINILADYGGAELERQSICGTFASQISDCFHDTTITLNLVHQNINYDMTLVGKYKVHCENDIDEKRYEYVEKNNSNGIAIMENIEQGFNSKHNTLISGSTNTKDYSIHGKGSRIINYQSSEHKNLDALLFFNYINLFNYDMDECNFAGETKYNFKFKLMDKGFHKTDLTITGSIELLSLIHI